MEKERGIHFLATGTGWLYEWSSNGMLKKVIRPDGRPVEFRYDALGRRTAKQYFGKVTRWVWDGNVPIHEWRYKTTEIQPDEKGESFQKEPIENITTWVFEEGTFVPTAKIQEGKQYSIVSDYLGTPIQMYDEQGKKTWECTLDINGKVLAIDKGTEFDCPFRYQGQYADEETGLYYNRFRYYSPNKGEYLSQDAFIFHGENPTIYGYVFDTNIEIDIFGLDIHHIIPMEVYKDYRNKFKNVKGYKQSVSVKAKTRTNLIKLDRPFHGNHPDYNKYVFAKVEELIAQNKFDLTHISQLQDHLRTEIGNALNSGESLNDYFKKLNNKH